MSDPVVDKKNSSKSGSSGDTRLLVTVGSTNFAVLTDFVSSPECLQQLATLGITHATIQYGSHAPQSVNDNDHHTDMHIDTFAYTSSLNTYMKAASIVVSHAGAGTILEAVDMGKPLVVVVNTSLMDNHQTELARAMQACGCCIVVNQDEIHDHLVDAIRNMLNKRNEMEQAHPPKRNVGAFARVVTQELVDDDR